MVYRIAIVTADSERDWASRELLKAANRLAKGTIVDPLSFHVVVDGATSIRINTEWADDYDAFIIRGFNRSGEIDYQFEVFELLQQQGKLVMNSPDALSLAESKSQTTYCLKLAGLPVPRTIVTQDPAKAAAAVQEFGTAVLKPLFGSHGVDIEMVRAEDGEDLLSAFFQKYSAAYIQEYVPNDGRDIRAFVVGDRIPAAMYRIAPEGRWKTNVFQGAVCKPCRLSPELRALCLEAAGLCGLDYTGVDVLEGPDGPVILEVNGAPSWFGLAETTRRNIALDVVRHVLRILDSGRSAHQPMVLGTRERKPSELPDIGSEPFLMRRSEGKS